MLFTVAPAQLFTTESLAQDTALPLRDSVTRGQDAHSLRFCSPHYKMRIITLITVYFTGCLEKSNEIMCECFANCKILYKAQFFSQKIHMDFLPFWIIHFLSLSSALSSGVFDFYLTSLELYTCTSVISFHSHTVSLFRTKYRV